MGLALAVAAAPSPQSALPDEPGPLQVFAAASLTDAFRELGEAFEAAHRRKVAFHFAGTQVLRTQVEQGADADVFASADFEHAEALRHQGLVPSFEPFARNAVAVITPAGRTRVRQLADLARPGVKVVVASPAVPAGRAAQAFLARLAASGEVGEDFLTRVEANVVSRETNVRLVLAKVVLGEADAGLVYATDARAGGRKVRAVPIPEPAELVTTNMIGVVAATRGPEAAQAFVTFVRGPEGRAILARHGFRP
jgi:molybdate transport system substrate-binding protein